MTGPAIRVDALGKQYRIGAARARYRTARDALTSVARGLGGRFRSRDHTAAEDSCFWALRDVSLAIAPGEAVGIIGGNGAGKSTLLKILSRITEPTTGVAEIRGRVGSLLEVGTGFHPELTGRENIYLNGAILGMRRREVNGAFDGIVDFAEVGKFIDTPVKHYSSGMYARLAFAVAAHLEPDILLVDEVLAVGDAAFQRKCLGRMSAVAGDGRTVLFVSHSMDAIQRLCPRAVLLRNGRVVADGDSARVVGEYLREGGRETLPGRWIDLSQAARRGTGGVRFTAVRYGSGDPGVPDHPYSDGPLRVDMRVEAQMPVTVPRLAAVIRDQRGTKLVNADTVSIGTAVSFEAGENSVSITIEALHLTPGRYVLGLWAADAVGEPRDDVEWAVEFDVVAGSVTGYGITPAFNGVVSCRFSVAGARA